MGEGVAKGGLACSYGYLGPTLTFSSSKALATFVSQTLERREGTRGTDRPSLPCKQSLSHHNPHHECSEVLSIKVIRYIIMHQAVNAELRWHFSLIIYLIKSTIITLVSYCYTRSYIQSLWQEGKVSLYSVAKTKERNRTHEKQEVKTSQTKNEKTRRTVASDMSTCSMHGRQRT